jgi:hypothetical protein
MGSIQDRAHSSEDLVALEPRHTHVMTPRAVDGPILVSTGSAASSPTTSVSVSLKSQLMVLLNRARLATGQEPRCTSTAMSDRNTRRPPCGVMHSSLLSPWSLCQAGT